MEKTMWWGYLHSNGTIHTKRWYGDIHDYTTDIEANYFVQKVLAPFAADTRDLAEKYIIDKLGKSK